MLNFVFHLMMYGSTCLLLGLLKIYETYHVVSLIKEAKVRVLRQWRNETAFLCIATNAT